MDHNKIKIEREERQLLLDLLEQQSPTKNVMILSHLQLKDKLEKGFIYQSGELGRKVVRLNKIISIKTSFGAKSGLQLVLPEDADIESNKFSIFSPLGCAIYGNAEGDVVEWYFENSIEALEIVQVTSNKMGFPLFFKRN